MNKNFSVNFFFSFNYFMVKLSAVLLGQICVSSCNKVATVRTLVDCCVGKEVFSSPRMGRQVEKSS